jgi:hypothetical protein
MDQDDEDETADITMAKTLLEDEIKSYSKDLAEKK